MESRDTEIYQDMINRGIHQFDADFISFRHKLHKDELKGIIDKNYQHVYPRLKNYLDKSAILVNRRERDLVNNSNELRNLEEREYKGDVLTAEQNARKEMLKQKLKYETRGGMRYDRRHRDITQRARLPTLSTELPTVSQLPKSPSLTSWQ